MDYRELYGEVMHYGKVDRMPVVHWDVWNETKELWLTHGKIVAGPRVL